MEIKDALKNSFVQAENCQKLKHRIPQTDKADHTSRSRPVTKHKKSGWIEMFARKSFRNITETGESYAMNYAKENVTKSSCPAVRLDDSVTKPRTEARVRPPNTPSLG